MAVDTSENFVTTNENTPHYTSENVNLYSSCVSKKSSEGNQCLNNTRVGTLIVATIYLQLIQNRYMFRSFTVLHCSHQHCVQPIVSDAEVVGYL